MNNIPDEIKELFKLNNIKKNFRISFPNGERDDITNPQLVNESVSLKESICSQDNLKYGLCEASVLEFQTIGVGNIKGCTIAAQIEIDISSLDEELIEDCGQTADDVDFTFYPVPYGVFTINSCQRQSDMKIRKMVAYDSLYSANLDSQVNEITNTAVANMKPYQRKTVYWAIENAIGYKGIKRERSMIEFPRHATSVSITESALVKVNGVSKYLHTYESFFNPTMAENDYYRISKGEEYDADVATVAENITDCVNRYKITEWNGKSFAINNPISLWVSAGGTTYSNTFIDDMTNITNLTASCIVRLDISDDEDCKINVQTLLVWGALIPYRIDKITIPDIELKEIETPVSDLSLRNLLQSRFELCGSFGCIDKATGNLVERTIINNFGLYPSESLYPSEDLYPNQAGDIVSHYNYKEFWYEEYQVQPIGTIVVNYIDPEGEEQLYHYTFDETAPNTYRMKDNWIIKNLHLTAAEIKTMLDTYFIPNIKGITYVPAEIEATGLPYLDAGDVVNLLTKDSGFETFIFRRTLKGIQALEDSIEAKGDEYNDDYGTNDEGSDN